MFRTFAASLLLLFAAACATAPPPALTAPALWAGLAPGDYAVGLRVTTLTTDPHPLQISVWYPSDRTSGTPLLYSDYVQLDGADAVTGAEKFMTSNGVSGESAHALTIAPMFARRDARALAGRRFPLVLIAQGNGESASSQAVLAEFLASHGHVVATIPSITRLTGPMKSESDIVPKAEAEAMDIDRAVTAMAAEPDVSPAPVAIVAHSFGARSGMLYAMHHPVSSFVSLEGGPGIGVGQQVMLTSKMLDLGVSFAPVLHFYELNDDRMNPDFRLLKSLRAPDLQLVRMHSMAHVHFSTFGFASVLYPDLAKVTKAGPELKQEVIATAQQTLSYIDAHQPRT